ncbi:MAG: DUF3109 family protein [Bacteroidales bacterium]|nr:DUF3109 family protein [Bacteroidales bacterium]
MLIIDNVLIDEDLFSECFCCNLSHCHGFCCVEGDAGAPLEEEEVGIIEDAMDQIMPYLTEEGKKVISQYGTFDYDMEGQLVTPLVHDKECVFVYYEQQVAKCAIEQAYMDGKIKFRKPVSCHLYPVRIEKFPYYERLTYHRWEVCRSAVELGKKMNISVFDFLQEPLARKYGNNWIKKVKKLKNTGNF